MTQKIGNQSNGNAKSHLETASVLGSRLKKLGERILSESAKVYKVLGIKHDRKLYSLLQLIEEKQPIGISEAAGLLGLTQPAVSQFFLELKQKKLVTSVASFHDSRKKLMRLSPEGKKLLQKVQPIEKAILFEIDTILKTSDINFLENLAKVEQATYSHNLQEKALDAIVQKNKA